MKKDLPTCPVEITIGLIGEKLKVLTNNFRQIEALMLVKNK